MRDFIGNNAFLFGLFIYAAIVMLGLVAVYAKRTFRLISYAFLAFGAGFQGYGLFIQWQITGMLPFTYLSGFFHLVALFCVLLYLIVGASYRLNLLDAFTAGLVFVLSLIAQLIGAPIPSEGGSMAILTAVHALTAFLSYAAFGILSLLSIQYLFQNHSLRKKKYHAFFKYLPSLQILQNVSRRLLAIALALLTLALVLGWVDFFLLGRPYYLALKIIAASIIWIAYGSLFFAGKFLTPTRFATVSVILFILALFMLFLIHGKPVAA